MIFWRSARAPQKRDPGGVQKTGPAPPLRQGRQRGKIQKNKARIRGPQTGQKYPDSDEQKKRDSRVFSGSNEEETRRRNKILAGELVREMSSAQEWAAALNRSNATGTRLFGSKTLGETEFERKANGALSIKGNIMAGSLAYDGPVIMQGSITSPTFNESGVTKIILNRGDFKFVNPVENKYKIDNGSEITAANGNIIVGDVFGRKIQVQDPDGKVGLYVTVERRTRLYSPRGKIVAQNAVNTVDLEADSVMALNLENDVRIRGREIQIYGNKITYDVEITLNRGGRLQFLERNSVLGLSDDAVIVLNNGKTFRLHDLKTRKIRDIAPELVPRNIAYGKNDTMIGGGFVITYEMLDGLDEQKRGWKSKLGL